MSDWEGKTRGVWHVARWMADSSNFGTQRTRLVSDEVGAVADGLIYFSQNCHFGIFFWSCLCCISTFIHGCRHNYFFNVQPWCLLLWYKVTLIKIRMLKKLPCLTRVFCSFKNCDALIRCDSCLPIGSLPCFPIPLSRQSVTETNYI